MRGEGGSGSLTVGNRNAGSSDRPLVLEMNEKQYKLCSSMSLQSTNKANFLLLSSHLQIIPQQRLPVEIQFL